MGENSPFKNDGNAIALAAEQCWPAPRAMGGLLANFDAVDKLGGFHPGIVTLEGATRAITTMGGSENDAAFIFRALDLNADGKLEFTELQTAILLISNDTSAKDQIQEKLAVLFRTFDADGDGKITVAEFHNAISTLFRMAALLGGKVGEDLFALQLGTSQGSKFDLGGMTAETLSSMTTLEVADFFADSVTDATFADADFDDDETVSQSEFATWMEHRESALFVRVSLKLLLDGLSIVPETTSEEP